MVALAVVLLGLLSALVAAAGPAELGAPRLGPIDGLTLGNGSAEQEGASPEGAEQPLQRPPLPGWLLPTAWTVALMAVALVVLRSLLRAEAPADPPSHEPPAARADGAVCHLVILALRDVARTAADDSRSAGQAGTADVVVRAWERLESVAAELGSARPPHATPTEFTAALLDRCGADPAAIGALLRLYHRARFSRAPLPPDAAGAAVVAFESVAASLEGPRRGPPAPGDRSDPAADPSSPGAGRR